MKLNNYEFDVLVNGRPVKVYSHYVNGENRYFIEAREGTPYTIRIKNDNSVGKILAIVAVDSLNVVTGKVSDGYKGRGYIVGPYRSVEVKGFRYSDESVGQFVFTTKNKSYAAGQGLGKNTGIISCNILSEKIQPAPLETNEKDTIFYETYRTPISESLLCDTSSLDKGFMAYNPMNTRASAQSKSLSKGFDMGTKWGEKVQDKIIRKSFDKGDIVATFNFYYASKEALIEMGVPVVDEKTIDLPPSFEGEYCKPPIGWH